MKKTIKTYGILVVASLFMMACGGSKGGEEHGEEGHGGHDEHGEEGTVSLTKQQMDAIGLKIVQIEKKNMSIGVQVTGDLELAPQDRADISPILGGIVKTITVIEGDKVNKGQVLATLEHPDFIQLQQDYINSINTLAYLEKDFQRQKKLYEEKVGSGKEFQKTSADYFNKKSKVKALKIKLKMLGLNPKQVANGTIYPVVPVVSPLNGTVSLVETNIGAYVAPLTKLFEVVNNDKLHADFRVYEKDINKIKVGQKIYFTTTSIAGEEFEGDVHAISPVFEKNPKALHVHADISNKKKNLIPGMYIQGRIISENTLTTVLPEHAVVTQEEKTYIFVKIKGKKHDHGHEETANTKENEHGEHTEKKGKDEHEHSGHEEGKWTFKMTEVIVGASSGEYIEVKLLKPLPKGAEIAGNGAYYLLAEMGKGETEHTH
ncbi:MAG: efflux transporter periplasmic adaptor subunit [Flavobacteriales bacterium]|nr:MAG: efflux transporter periplasmic adaptor subunit [Flavobacteriales bacterium]